MSMTVSKHTWRRIPGTRLRICDFTMDTNLLSKNTPLRTVQPKNLIQGEPVIPKPVDRQTYLDALETLELMLKAEDGFFGELERSARDTETSEDLGKFLHHDEVLHIARFFFLLDTFDVRDEIAVGKFIDNHNQQLTDSIRQEKPNHRRETELRKAAIVPERKYKLQNYFMSAGEPAFDRRSLEQFLYAHIGRTQLHNRLKQMVAFGFLEEREVPIMNTLDTMNEDDNFKDIGSSKKLIVLAKNRTLVSAYADYLTEIRREVSATVLQAVSPRNSGSDAPSGITRQ